MTVRCVHLRRHLCVFTIDRRKTSVVVFVFRPIYWYPNVYQRSVRSDLIPSYYESSELPSFYPSGIENEIEDDDDDDYDDDDDGESDDNPG